MEGQEPPPQPPPLLPSFNPPYLFASSSSLHPPLEHQILPDIDWVSLLSGQSSSGLSENGPMMESSSSVMAENGVEEEKGFQGR
ncbi:hypothetical protein JRO89_XS01G0318100 [Xanthoceras sorbifolium]|uniref:Uncharacterized protein n=1 Tax=Xanthoceras sorbifolium TaxID=99658 RepID=A0ABQ8IMJ7_9ROSI|nr:hypothetical protein JRO89_XS01G0318100 [Xanthoceras sorbifolium]